MTEEQKAAVINARCATALIRSLGMQAENEQRKYRNEAMAYVEADFTKVIEEEGIGHNDIQTLLQLL